jgi:exopolysaccharide production protein ExoY
MGSVPNSGANLRAGKQSESSVNQQNVGDHDENIDERCSVDNTAALNRASAAALQPRPDIGVRSATLSQAVPAPVGCWTKRALDILVASTTLLLMAPLMLIIAAIILITMGRPVLFVQQCVGFNRKVFGCFKFRSMVGDADQRLARYLQHCPEAARAWADAQTLKDDPRVTWFGHILRKSSLDELPQLFNVLRGEMSCIGPRPVPVKELNARYGFAANDYARAKPGLTGMSQVSDRRRMTPHSRRVAYDRIYARRRSLLLDMNILFRTLLAPLKSDQSENRRTEARQPADQHPNLPGRPML